MTLPDLMLLLTIAVIAAALVGAVWMETEDQLDARRHERTRDRIDDREYD